MRDLSLHILDLMQNSIRAQAALVKLDVSLSEDGLMTVVIEDDGTGMSQELLARVTSPFATTRTTRKVGLGIPLLQQNAMLSGGDVRLESTEGVGTLIQARFNTSSIDCLPVGDLAETLATIIMGSPDRPEFSLTCTGPAGETSFSTEEIRAALGPEVSLAEPEVVQWIRQSLQEEIEPILGGIMR